MDFASFLWEFNGISGDFMDFLWGFHGIYWIFMRIQWNSVGELGIHQDLINKNRDF